jgi:uncharacterized protein YecT (DUF1311 family)
MATEDPSERLARALPSFHADADDTPREAGAGPDDGPPGDADGPSGITLAPWPDGGTRARRRGPPVAPFAAAAVLAVIVAGVVVAASLANRRDERAVAAAGPALQIDASPVAPAPIPQAARDAGKLEVLPDLPPTPIVTAPPAAPYPEIDDGAAPDDATAGPPQAPPPPAGRDRAAAGRDCAAAPTRAEALVCADPGLAEADRRMRRAYVAALRNGAPADLLAREQDDWLEARDDAARYSREALEDVYRQRIAELRDIADYGWD